jgi:hypothetical protein
MKALAWTALVSAATLFSFVALLAPVGPYITGVIGTAGISVFILLGRALERETMR